MAGETAEAHGAETWDVVKHFLTAGASQPTGRTAAEILAGDENSLHFFGTPAYACRMHQCENAPNHSVALS